MGFLGQREFDPLDAGDKTIAFSGNRQDKPLARGLALQKLAQHENTLSKIGFADRDARPYLLDETGPTYRVPVVFNKHSQNLEQFGRQVDPAATPKQNA